MWFCWVHQLVASSSHCSELEGRKEEEIDRWIGATAAVMRTLHQVIVIKGRDECKKANPTLA